MQTLIVNSMPIFCHFWSSLRLKIAFLSFKARFEKIFSYMGNKVVCHFQVTDKLLWG